MTAEVSTVPTDYGWGWEALLRTWQEMDVPAGWRAEIVGEGITMTPPPGNEHNRIADAVDDALRKSSPGTWGIYQNLGLAVPLCAKLYIPDLVVVPRARLAELPDNEPVTADKALLVVEITSKGNAEVDRKAKLWGYAHGPVPYYLLIDRFDEAGPSVTLFAEPGNGHYRHSVHVPFGDKIEIPEPINLRLDTSGF